LIEPLIRDIEGLVQIRPTSSRTFYSLRSSSSRAACTPHHLALHTLSIKSRYPPATSSRASFPRLLPSYDFCLRRWPRESRLTATLPASPTPRGNRRTRPMIPARLRRDRLDFRLFTFHYYFFNAFPPLPPYSLVRVARWSLGRLLTSPAQRQASLYSRSKGETSLSS
jgi:hypothetical protein